MRGLAFFAMWLLGSCATPARQVLSADEVFDSVAVVRDDFAKMVTFDAPDGGHDEGPGNGARWFLRAVQSMEVPSMVRFCLRFHRFSPEWCLYNGAWTHDGKRLSVERTDSSVDADGYRVVCRDYYVVSLSREDLELAARQGMKMKVSGRRGDWVLSFPAYYAAGFLARVDGGVRPAAPVR